MNGPGGDIAVSARGLLRDFSEYGVLAWADVQPALHLTYLCGERDQRVQLALGLAVRALRSGSMCVDLARVADEAFDGDDAPAPVPAGAWPEPGAWLDAVAASPCTTVGDGAASDTRPLRLVDGLLYLERYWGDQETVRGRLLGLLALPPRPVAEAPPAGIVLDPDQARAVRTALASPVSVIAGGPGTGKTTIIRQVLAGARAADPDVLVAFAAPTGKAAARLTSSLVEPGLRATTIHRLLGWKPGSRSRFAHDAATPLPHDLVVVDEVSMVSMTLMARLLAALRPQARLVLVGDPHQLASVEAGAVLADIVDAGALSDVVTTLLTNHRSAGAVAALADAIRLGDADAALAVLAAGDPAVRLVAPEAAQAAVRRRVTDAGRVLHEAARAGDAAGALQALDSHRLLCAHRTGRHGVAHWTTVVRGWLAEDVPGYATDDEFYIGRPLLMTRNTSDLGLANGDTGVVVSSDAGSRAVFDTGEGLRPFSPWVLDGLESVDAMTVHKSQGSQFGRVSVVLPPEGSPLLTRELLYTAVTRAQESVVLVGTPESVRAAVTSPARRTSGLAARLARLAPVTVAAP